jgi:uncharacterized protein YdeI (YjbR/CyaY-like superfamily)
MPDSLPTLKFGTQAAWHGWLSKHHATSAGVWLQIAKQASGIDSPTYAEALDSALCYGWIDGQRQKCDDDYYLLRFTPRRPNSIWSEINRVKTLALIERGLMQPAGLAAIEHAKANGRWETAYGRQSHASMLPELEAALGEHPKAASFFKTLNSQNRYAILFRLQTAKKVETRTARLAKFIAMLERRETLH